MQQFLAITKALSDETRVRALLSLREGELCLCQIIELLRMAPSTVSRHMDILTQAGLVERRKQGRWQYFSLVKANASPIVRQALAWALQTLKAEPMVVADATQLCCVRKKDVKEVSACYRIK